MAKAGGKTAAELLAIEQRRARVAEAYLRGQYQHDIALREGVSQSTVSLDLKAIQAQWKASSIRNLDAHKAQELARIDQLERTYWEAWGRSLREGRDGDPRFLDGVQKCIVSRCKLLDLMPKEKKPDEKPSIVPVSEAERERRLERFVERVERPPEAGVPEAPKAGGPGLAPPPV
jgi:hypothetical protein